MIIVHYDYGICVVLTLLFGGLIFFQRAEGTLADVV